MRMDVSSGKSMISRFAICSGLHARAHRRDFLRPWRRPFQAIFGPAITEPPGVAMLPASRFWTYVRSAGLVSSLAGLGRLAARSACHCAVIARYSAPPPRVAALRRNSREIVEAARPSRAAISRTPAPRARARAISSRSANDRYLPVGGCADGARCDGGIPPHSRNHLVPTACDTPASLAASSLEQPAAIASQNARRSDRCNTGGRPGERNFARPGALVLRPSTLINTSDQEVLRRQVELTQFSGAEFVGEVARIGARQSMDGRGCWRDNVFVERLWRSVKYEEVYLKAHDSVSAARHGLAAYFDFYNTRRPHQGHDGKTPDMVYFAALPPLAAAA